MLIGTFPGKNRKEQLDTITDIFKIPMESTLINVEYINGNGWFTGYFDKEEERDHCIKEINKLNDISPTKSFNIIKLESLTNSSQPIRSSNNKAYTSSQYKGTTNNQKEGPNTKTNHLGNEQTVQILDIPADFSTNRIKGALKNYGTIKQIYTQTGKQMYLKTATATFSNCKLDLKQVWAIPMGDTMARIVPLQDCEETPQETNLQQGFMA